MIGLNVCDFEDRYEGIGKYVFNGTVLVSFSTGKSKSVSVVSVFCCIQA